MQGLSEFFRMEGDKAMKGILALILVLVLSVAPALSQCADGTDCKSGQSEKAIIVGARIQQSMATRYDAGRQTDFFQERAARVAEQRPEKKFPLWAKVALAGAGIAGSAILIKHLSRSTAAPIAGHSILVEGQQ
jgi:hypothetical protein